MTRPCVCLVKATLMRPGSLRNSDVVGVVLTRLMMTILFSLPWYWFTVCTSTSLSAGCLLSSVLISVTCPVYIVRIVICRACTSCLPLLSEPELSTIHFAMFMHSEASPLLNRLDPFPLCFSSLNCCASGFGSRLRSCPVSIQVIGLLWSFHSPDILLSCARSPSILASVLIFPS